MAAVPEKTFDGGDVLTSDLAHGDAAEAYWTLAHQHRAGAALLDAATELGPGQADRVPDRPEQRRFRF